VVAVPNPLFFGRPTIKNFGADDYGDLGQSHTAFNIQVVWMRPLTDRVDFRFFLGPSIVRVSQDIASATETADAAPTTKRESATTGKAGTVGADLSYWLNDRYSVGGFLRYAAGEVDLPSVEKLKFGGLQIAGGIRARF
jgi:hypothetical protein